jgi:antitoxin component of MazEF toxin-antitoxin module
MAKRESWSPTELLRQVKQLAAARHSKSAIAARLGMKNDATFTSRLVRASQLTGKPIPTFQRRTRATAGRKRVEVVEIRKRGRGGSFGVNVPQEPLERLGVKAGDQLAVAARRGRIMLQPQAAAEHKTTTPKPPRLVRRQSRGAVNRN